MVHQQHWRQLPSVESNGSTTDNGYWIETIVTAAPGFVIDPTSFELVGGAGGAGDVRSAYIFDNVDGFPTNLATNASSGPTITGGDLLASGTFTAVRGAAGPPAMNEIQVASFPSTDVNLSSFTVRAYFDTEGNVNKNIDLGTIELDGSVVAQGPVLQSTWKSNASGDFNVAANWSSGVPDTVGAEADFLARSPPTEPSSPIPPSRSAKSSSTIAPPPTLSPARLALNLTLQASSGSALVDVQAGTQEINLPLVLASNTTLETDATTASLVIANPVTVNSGVTLTTTGSGSVVYQSIINVQPNAAMTFASSTHAHESVLPPIPRPPLPAECSTSTASPISERSTSRTTK